MLNSGAEIVIRADASSKIGIGHIMRCLALADGLYSVGCCITFVCRRHPGHLQALIESKQYRCYLLEQCTDLSPETPASFMEMQAQDAQEFIVILNGIGKKPAWVICDHYELDRIWHEMVYEYTDRLMVIDDLADRDYSCDILLDPSYLRQPKAYRDLVPEECKLLTGTKFALLRDEFFQARLEINSFSRLPIKRPRILVTMGGRTQ